MTIDWTKPIETMDGEPLALSGASHLYEGFEEEGGRGDAHVMRLNGLLYGFYRSEDGTPVPWNHIESPPIRNRAEAPDPTARIAELEAWQAAAIAKHPDLAPLDPDLIEARRIAVEYNNREEVDGEILRKLHDGGFDSDQLWYVPQILEAIKRGRQLEREGK